MPGYVETKVHEPIETSAGIPMEGRGLFTTGSEGTMDDYSSLTRVQSGTGRRTKKHSHKGKGRGKKTHWRVHVRKSRHNKKSSRKNHTHKRSRFNQVGRGDDDEQIRQYIVSQIVISAINIQEILKTLQSAKKVDNSLKYKTYNEIYEELHKVNKTILLKFPLLDEFKETSFNDKFKQHSTRINIYPLRLILRQNHTDDIVSEKERDDFIKLLFGEGKHADFYGVTRSAFTTSLNILSEILVQSSYKKINTRSIDIDSLFYSQNIVSAGTDKGDSLLNEFIENLKSLTFDKITIGGGRGMLTVDQYDLLIGKQKEHDIKEQSTMASTETWWRFSPKH